MPDDKPQQNVTADGPRNNNADEDDMTQCCSMLGHAIRVLGIEKGGKGEGQGGGCFSWIWKKILDKVI